VTFRSRTAHGLLALAAAAALSCRDQRAPAPKDDGMPGQRVFRPPARVVRALPPHGIQATGVGPYSLGAELKDVLNTLPHGPRIELLQIEDLVGYRLVRVEQGTILVGIGQSGRVSFIAVTDPEIAKTEGGLGVGAEIDRLREALGPERRTGARDPHLVELERLPGARVLVEDGRAAAIVLGPDGLAPAPDLGQADALSGGAASARPPAAAAGDCTPESAAQALAGEPLASLARAGDQADVPIAHGCFTGSSPEAVVQDRDELILLVGEPGHMRRAPSQTVPGLLFAGAVDADGDGRHELLAVSEQRTAEALAVRVELLRGEGGRLVGTGADQVYRVTAGQAAPVGAKLKDIRLLLEARTGTETIEVTGLYVHEVGGQVRSAAPLLPKTLIPRPRRRSDAGGSSGVRAARPSERKAAEERP
jgi:hypothetical protein